MTSHNVAFIDVIGALCYAALYQNRNGVLIWLPEVCFIFTEPINAIYMRPLYKAVTYFVSLHYER